LMKALVLEDYCRLELRDVPRPEPGDDELLVRVRACGICGSDVHGWDGSTGRRIPPLVMGHEAAGEVVDRGRGARRYRVGARVTFDSTIYCGRCIYCREGLVNLCDNRRVLGVSCEEYRQNGAMAEFVVVPERIVYPLPDSVPYEHAAMVEAVSVAVHAVRRGAPVLGENALVVGCGMIGQLIVQALRRAGCTRVLVTDVRPERVELALAHGADDGWTAGGDIGDEVRRRTGGRGVDLAVEAVGRAESVAGCVASVRKGGRVCLVGNLAPQVALPLQTTVTRELTLLGCCSSSGEYPTSIEVIASGQLCVDRLISAVSPLEEGPQWFDRLSRGEPQWMKVVLQP
jgi:L-iditol 2-dehydrogenase